MGSEEARGGVVVNRRQSSSIAVNRRRRHRPREFAIASHKDVRNLLVNMNE